jgi:hypothetical protein
MTDKSTDVLTALKEDIETNINACPELKGKHLYVYDPAQLSQAQQRTSLPFVIFHYAGMRPAIKSHNIFFDLYLIGNSASLNQIQNTQVVPTITEILQKLRKSMACNTTATQRKWELDTELPDFGVDDKLIYRQRWFTSYQIIR